MRVKPDASSIYTCAGGWMSVRLNTKNTSIVSLEFKLPVARFSAENASINKYEDAASRAFIDRILQANMRLLLVAIIH